MLGPPYTVGNTIANDDEQLVKLTAFPTEAGASAVVAALERAGVKATATGGYTAGFVAEAPGWVHVLVAEQDLDQAREVLTEVDKDNADIDWSQVDVGEADEDEEQTETEESSAPGVYGSWVWKALALLMVLGFIASYARSVLYMIMSVFD